MISFKWRHFKKDIILMLVRWSLAYSLSYRDIEELAAERALKVDHSTVQRWVVRYSPQLEENFRQRYKRPVGGSWRMDGVPQKHKAMIKRFIVNCCKAVGKMVVGPPKSADRSRFQTTPSGCY